MISKPAFLRRRQRDELEELKRQQQEDKELDEQCRLIDHKARSAQHEQEDAQKERERIVRQVGMKRRIRIKEQELESAQIISTFIRQNLSEEDHFDGASAPTPSSLQGDVATSSFYDLPPSKIFTPAPNLIRADSHSDVSSTPPVSQHNFPTGPLASQTLHMPQQIQRSLAPVQAPSLPPVATGQATLSSVPQVSAQVPNYTASMPFPGQPTLTGSLPPMHTMSFQQPQSVCSHIQTPNVMDLFIASAYGIPRPSLPVFKSGRESDFALLKMALDNLLDNHPHLTEQYKYQILLQHIHHPGASKLARSCMHNARLWSTKAASPE